MGSEIKVGQSGWYEAHLQLYLGSGGVEGHYIDFTPYGGLPDTPCLILKTVGRQTGKPRLSPLVYGRSGQALVVIASKGGAPKHPAWYLNLKSQAQVELQVGINAYRAGWREAVGDQREQIWRDMEDVFPPFRDLKHKTDRYIPVLLLELREEINNLALPPAR
jgi:deazaflavin-dependent oxidoreductase (nitroreductase family)